MDRPCISVIVPVYNVEKYLDRCVSSIVGQTYSDLEVILVDDGSPDACPAMCDEWAERDSRIRVIHKENGGLSDARNAGLRVASGELISFVDSDDWLSEDFYSVLYGAMTATDADLAECGYVMTAGETVTTEPTDEITVCNTEEALEKHIRIEMFKQVVWNKLYRRSVITAEFEKGKCHEDEFWTYQIIANCKKLAHIDRPMYFYFQREDSIMGEKYSVKRLDAVEAKVRRNTFIKTHYPQLACMNDADLCFTCIYHGQLIIKNLDRKYFKQAFARINEFYPQNAVLDRKSLKLSYFCWLMLAKISLRLCCSIRNALGVGI